MIPALEEVRGQRALLPTRLPTRQIA